MSNFVCEICGAACIDSPEGYVTGCEHYPLVTLSAFSDDTPPSPSSTDNGQRNEMPLVRAHPEEHLSHRG